MKSEPLTTHEQVNDHHSYIVMQLTQLQKESLKIIRLEQDLNP